MRTQAIIIKKQPNAEFHQAVSCYTREFGKLTGVAKGSLKPTSMQSMHLDVLTCVEFELIYGRAQPIITAAQQENAYRNLKSFMPAVAVASFFLEVMDKIIFDMQPDPHLWDFYNRLFNGLDLNPATAGLELFRNGQAELLKILGYPPQIAGDGRGFSRLDGVFEQTAQKQLTSLKFLYSVI